MDQKLPASLISMAIWWYNTSMVYCGTCSWSEKTLLQSGEFYPKEIKTPEERLKYYAGHFRTVEVDSSYYAIPARQTTALWAERTPDDFIFHIKVYGAMTGHGVEYRTLPPDVSVLLPLSERKKKFVYIRDQSLLREIAEKFRDSMLPLSRAGKLGLLVFQFSPWFLYTNENLKYILFCREAMQGLPLAVEFRHGSWLTPDRRGYVFTFLKDHQLIYVSADEPQYESLATVPFLPEVTGDTAYFRFHGRNRENWLKKGIETSMRYAYLYSEEELRSFIPKIRELSKKTKATYLMFNNCHGGFAVRNALKMKEEIRKEGL